MGVLESSFSNSARYVLERNDKSMQTCYFYPEAIFYNIELARKDKDNKKCFIALMKPISWQRTKLKEKIGNG